MSGNLSLIHIYVRTGESEIPSGTACRSSSEIRDPEERYYPHVYHRDDCAVCGNEFYDLCGTYGYLIFRPGYHMAVRFDYIYKAEKYDAGSPKAVYGALRQSDRMDFCRFLHRVPVFIYAMGTFRSASDRVGRDSCDRGYRRNRLFLL